MRIIKASTVLRYAKEYPAARKSLSAWLLIASRLDWQSIDEVRKTYPHADAATVSSGAIVTIFNIAGNNYRLITAIHYNRQMVFIRDFLTHAEYSKQAWKGRH
jgi:mRNA interferase HigB